MPMLSSVSHWLPNQTTARVLAWLLVALTLALVIALGRAAWKTEVDRRWRHLLLLGVALALGTFSATHLFNWNPGVPDIIQTQGGTYEWGSGIADEEPAAGGCQTHAQLLSHGFQELVPVGWLTGASTDGQSWSGTVGPSGYMRVYRADRWDLVVIPRGGCYVVFVEQG